MSVRGRGKRVGQETHSAGAPASSGPALASSQSGDCAGWKPSNAPWKGALPVALREFSYQRTSRQLGPPQFLPNIQSRAAVSMSQDDSRAVLST